jgi:hypothetical protein
MDDDMEPRRSVIRCRFISVPILAGCVFEPPVIDPAHSSLAVTRRRGTKQKRSRETKRNRYERERAQGRRSEL